MADRQAFAFDKVLARHGDIEQQIDEMVFEQVDFVDVEETAIGLGEQTGFEALFAGGQRAFEIERADDAIFGGAKRQIDKGHRDFGDLLAGAGAAIIGARGGIGGRAAIAAAGDDLHRRQQGGERAHRGRFAGAAIAEDHDAAQARFDSGHQQRLFHFGLADDCRKGEGRCHAVHLA